MDNLFGTQQFYAGRGINLFHTQEYRLLKLREHALSVFQYPMHANVYFCFVSAGCQIGMLSIIHIQGEICFIDTEELQFFF